MLRGDHAGGMLGGAYGWRLRGQYIREAPITEGLKDRNASIGRCCEFPLFPIAMRMPIHRETFSRFFVSVSSMY